MDKNFEESVGSPKSKASENSELNSDSSINDHGIQGTIESGLNEENKDELNDARDEDEAKDNHENESDDDIEDLIEDAIVDEIKDDDAETDATDIVTEETNEETTDKIKDAMNSAIKDVMTHTTDDEAIKVIEQLIRNRSHSQMLPAARRYQGPCRFDANNLSFRRQKLSALHNASSGAADHLENTANTKDLKRASNSASLKGVSRTNTRKRRANTRQIMAEWTQTFDAPKFDADSVFILILVILGLIVCPSLTIVKSGSALSSEEFTAPLEYKRCLSTAICVASILVGIILIVYILLLPCVRSVYPLLETPRLSYSEQLLSWMHSTVGARLAYGCVSQSQVLKRKFNDPKL